MQKMSTQRNQQLSRYAFLKVTECVEVLEKNWNGLLVYELSVRLRTKWLWVRVPLQ